MQRITFYLRQYPECYLLLVMLLVCYTPPFSINALGVAVALIIGLQLLVRSRTSGIFIASAFLLFNLYLILALVDEVAEFSTANSASIQLAAGGACVIGLNLIFSVLMMRKYVQAIHN